MLPGDNELLARKLFARFERLVLRSKGLLNFPGNHFESPNLFDCPWIKIPLPPVKDIYIVAW